MQGYSLTIRFVTWRWCYGRQLRPKFAGKCSWASVDKHRQCLWCWIDIGSTDGDKNTPISYIPMQKDLLCQFCLGWNLVLELHHHGTGQTHHPVIHCTYKECCRHPLYYQSRGNTEMDGMVLLGGVNLPILIFLMFLYGIISCKDMVSQRRR